MRKLIPFYLFILIFISGNSQTTDNIRINEILIDNNNANSTWVELYNTSNNPINLSDYYFTNDPNNVTKFSIEDSITLNPHAYFVFNSQDSLSKNTNYLNFPLNVGLSPMGISYFGIYRKNDSTLIDSLTYQANFFEKGVSIGIIDNEWKTLASPSPLAENQAKMSPLTNGTSLYMKIFIIIGLIILAFIILKLSRKSNNNNKNTEEVKNITSNQPLSTNNNDDEIDPEMLALIMAMHIHLNNDNHEVEKTGFWLANNPTQLPWSNRSYNFKKTPTIKK